MRTANRWFAENAAALLSVLVVIFRCDCALAHQVNFSNAWITITPERAVDVVVAMKGTDLDRAAGTRLTEGNTGLVRPEALAKGSSEVAAYVTAHAVILRGDGTSCRARASRVVPDGDGVTVSARWFCGGFAGRLRYRSTLLLDVAPSARQVVLIRDGNALFQDLLDAAHRETTITAGAAFGTGAVVERYIAAGAAYAFIGFDHVALLIAMLLWVRRFGSMLTIAAALAAGESVTLWPAVLGLIRVPSAIVESAIAASVLVAAALNFVSADADRRWRAAFVLGLVHGFGFAETLRSFGLPEIPRTIALASFDIGVAVAQGEIGVIAMVLLFGLDRLLAQRRRPATAPSRSAPAVYAVSALIAAFAGYRLIDAMLLRS